ncbi:MAG TPA: NAD(P)/FAD-dependent oxidoreductase, partial [Vicinamibacteria bacterium]
MSRDYDGIILGSGHNSLILQAYLGRAGLRVLCLEKRDVPGGGLATFEHERFPGFRHSIHSFFHRGIRQAPWYADLDLERHGAHYLEPELNVALVSKSGASLEWWTDFERTVASFEQWSAKDAATLRRWREAFLPVVERILVPEAQAPPLPPERRQALLEKSAPGRLLLATSALSPLAFVEREFEHPLIKAGLLFFNGLREVDLRCPGFGHHIAMLLASTGKAQMLRGGSAALADALLRAVETSGGTVRLRTEPRRILVERGRAVGVETTNGEILRARLFVASGLNPHQTFLDLLEERDLPGTWRQKAAGFRYNLIAPLFGLNLCLSEP